MSERDDTVSLRHMTDAAREAVEYTHELSFDQFQQDGMRVLAVTRLIEIIGEAARRLSQQLRTQHPEIQWREIIGARDRLIHGYDMVDLNRVWRICTEDLPVLVGQLEAILDRQT